MSEEIKEEIKGIADHIMRLHYEKNDVDGVISYFDEPFSWIGAGEHQFEVSLERAKKFFLKFKGEIPKCRILEAEYYVDEIERELYLCTGRFWVETDPSVPVYAREHQRITFVFRRTEEKISCLHIHNSNPYLAMRDNEVFPDEVSKYSYHYIQEKVRILEEEMAERNRQMEVIMRSIKGGMKSSRDDEDFSYSYVSDEAAALFGYTVQEFIKKTGGTAAGAVYPPDLNEALQHCRNTFAQGKEDYSVKYRVQCKDGSLKWILDSGKRVKDETGRYSVNSLYLDITDSEKDTREILRQKELLNSIYDTVPCGILRFLDSREEYQMVSMNRAVLKILGYDSEQELLDDWKDGVADHVFAGDRQKIVNSYKKLKRQGDLVRVEYRVCHKDGKIHWVEGLNMIVGMEQGKRLIQRTMLDITERIRLQNQLIQEQEMYRLAMENSSDMMFEYKWKEDVLRVFSPAPAESGKNIRRIEYEHFTERLCREQLVHEEDIPLVITNICRGKCEDFDVRIHNGEKMFPEKKAFLWFRIRGSMVERDGKPERIVGTMRNIEEIKQALSENTEVLYQNQMAKEALLEAYEVSKQASQAKSDFLSRMSHDIRTPMNAIMGMALIAEEHMDCMEKVRECIKKIQFSGKHLLNLLNEVLDMSKIESGTLSLNRESVSIEELLYAVTDMLQVEAEAKRQHMKVQKKVLIHDQVRGDSVRIRQIFLNLVGNAVKYTPEGGTIVFSAEEKFIVNGVTGCYEFQVRDNGIGMSREFQTKMFTPFERAEDSRVSKIQGTGLGMAISKNLIQMMNGTIEVESEENKGTCITVILPLKLDEHRKAHGGEEKREADDGVQKLRGVRVLLAEDNELNQEIVQELLTMEGMEVECADNGKEAVEKFQKSEEGVYQVILMDIQMPYMDGYEASRQIRAMERKDAKKVPIIAVTANAFADDVYRVEQAGMNAHLAKPIDVKQLRALLCDLVR